LNTVGDNFNDIDIDNGRVTDMVLIAPNQRQRARSQVLGASPTLSTFKKMCFAVTLI